MSEKTIFSLLFVFFASITCFSQDIVTLKTGEDVKAKILEVSTTEIRFKRFDNLDGPVFIIPKTDIIMITYQNGTKDVIQQATNGNQTTNQSPANAQMMPFPARNPNDTLSETELLMRGRQDAEQNYKGQNSGSGWTFATTLFFSPLAGLIPASVCSSSVPADINLNITNYTLMKYPAYAGGYRQQALKIKQKKVWSGYAAGFFTFLTAVLIVATGN